ncbi:MAG: hypothetical protein Q7S00_04580, partial [bacterium]|nr:hypothetical protein [bacterium]
PTGGTGGNAQFIAGLLQTTYEFSDIWDGTLRYGFTWDLDSSDISYVAPLANGTAAVLAAGTSAGLGANGTLHDLALATGYQIADGAKVIFEGRFDLSNPSAAGVARTYSAGIGTQFAYSF